VAADIELSGSLDYAHIPEDDAWADVVFFTGIIAGDGDRDGLPNVIPEAMAYGVPVVTTPVSGTTEAIADGITGQVLEVGDLTGWLAAVRRLRGEPDFIQRTCSAARLWVEQEFNSQINSARLATELSEVLK
jgi:glycosyltransferase involved in cell wall biosynthesis